MIVLSAGGFRLLLLWFNTRLAFTSGAELSSEIYRRTLYQPYHIHVARNSSEVISGIISKTRDVVHSVLLPFLILISSVVFMAAILLTLIVIDPLVATVVTVGFGASYGLITWVLRKKVRRNSKRIAHEQTQVIKALHEGLGGIRDVLLDGSQSVYSQIYNQANYPLQRAQGNNGFIANSPRYAMEALGIVLIAALAYGLSLKEGGIVAAFPLLGALALGAQRLLPVMQQSYSSWTNIAANYVSLIDVLDLLDQPVPVNTGSTTREPLQVHKEIHFNDVHFRYNKNGQEILNGVHFNIPKGARVAFVGSTGSGKSTVLDLFMGLLEPDKGEITVDGQSIHGECKQAWQQSIAHVPQAIYLADATVSENIAFGVPREHINFDQVRQSAQQAQIAEFIESRPDGYDAVVGERGIQLSGGQRQRIGIARALYKKASVLVFDEATSALDNATEKAVMEAVDALNRNLTILFVAHRLTTVQHCDIIIELEHGQVVAQGTYQELLDSSPGFRAMAASGGMP